MYKANIKTTGRYISGEIKVAVGLRILAGGSYLDAACIFGIHFRHIQTIFQECVKDWFCCDQVSPLILDDALQNEEALIKFASFFANGKCPSFTGVIGVLHGWLVRIRLLALKRFLGSITTGGYWSPKGFYLLCPQCAGNMRQT